MAENASKTTVTLDISGSNAITLPAGAHAADMAILRDGQDLILRDGNQEITIEHYFLADPQPDLMSENGSRLSPDLIQSFVTHEGSLQYADAGTLSDVSPVGEITDLEGAGTIMRTDGTTESLSLGMPVYQGDVITTDDGGAANITFIDESSFAISDNARMAIDEFVFDPSSESGATDISVLKGVFLFTSGLIGRENPDAVEIDTPVGSIGIRGTIIGGDIKPSGEESQISVIEGAIVVRNATGESILSSQFETVKLNNFNADIREVGVLSPQDVSADYGAVKNVSPSLFSSINDIIREQSNDKNPNESRHNESDTSDETDTKDASDQSDNTKPSEQTIEAEPQPAEADTQQEAKDPAPKDVQDTLQEDVTRLNNRDFKQLKLRMMDEQNDSAEDAPIELRDMGILDLNDVQDSLKESIQLNPNTGTNGPLEFKTDNDVNESASAGTVVGRVGPTNAVSFGVTYSLVDDAGGYFAINPNNGLVFVTPLGASNLDFETTDSYDITIRATRNSDGVYRDTDLSIDIDDVNDAPTLGTTGANINEGASVTLTAAMVNGADQDGDTLYYQVGNLNNVSMKVSGVTTNRFTQTELDNGLVVVTHDGSETLSGSLDIRAFDGTAQSTPQTLNLSINSIDDAPVLTVNSATITEGASITLGVTDINATDTDTSASSLVYTLSNQTNVTVKVNGVNATTFTHNDLTNGLVTLTHDDSETLSASVDVIVTDGITTTASQTLNLSVSAVNDAPTLTLTSTSINSTASMTLTTAMIDGLDAEGDSLTYTVNGTNNGSLLVNGTTSAYFTQAQLTAGQVSFRHDGTGNPTASLNLSVSDGISTSGQNTLTFNVVNQAITSVTFDQTTIDTADIVVRIGEDNQAIGSFTITDPDQINGFTYDVLDDLGNADPRFVVTETVNGAFLELAAGESMDTAGEYNITLRVTDVAGNQESQDITIDVRNDAISLSNAPESLVDYAGSTNAPDTYMDVGDYNRDGYTDRAFFNNTGNGRMDIEYGSDAGFSFGTALHGNTNFQIDGTFVNVGDINGGGATDIAVGHASYNNGAGAIRLQFGNTGHSYISSSIAGAQFGANIAAVGDATGDGFNDILISAPGEDAVYLLHGHATGLNSSGNMGSLSYTKIHDGGDTDTQLNAISGAGDFNGDGLSDFIVTLTDTDAGQTANIAYIIYGSSSLGSSINLHDLTDDANKAFKIFLMPEDTGNSSAIDVQAIGDVDGDGYDDIEITALDADADGERYTIYGHDARSEVNDVTTSGVATRHDANLIGNSSNNTLNDGSYDHTTLKGGDGDDRIIINKNTFQLLDGGLGDDLLEINSDSFPQYFGTSVVDLRDSTGQFKGFETIKINDDNADLKIYMSDVLNLLKQSDTGQLIFDNNGTNNAVIFYDSGITSTDLLSESFDTKTTTTHNGETYYSFEQSGTGYEVLLDASLINAGNGGA